MTERKTDYSNAAQQRVLDLITLLAGHELQGLAPGEIAKAMKVSPGMVTRDLYNLAVKGVAEQIAETGRWRLGPRLVQVALAFTQAVQRNATRLAEINQRYTRQP